MAGSAGAPFLLVDVNEMQVLIAVSKPRESRRPLMQHESFFMALEAQFVSFQLERAVEFRWKIVFQDAEVFGTVRLMASRALF